MNERVGSGPVPAGSGSPSGGRESVEDWLARRLVDAGPGVPPAGLLRVLRVLGGWDRRTYEVVAGLSTPLLDEPMRVVSRVADHSKPWLATAAVLAVVGGPTGRRAALAGVAAIGATSFVVNQPMKRAGSRRRPDRRSMRVPVARWIPMPASTSFPSGHSASAAAFAVAVGGVIPQLRVPLRVAAATVAFSRVYTGVHYPGDVIVGAVTGAVVGRTTSRLVMRMTRAR
ncbi:phosphatase PAP2 family protein [Cellulomonas sp. ICMP 17802]|uniref:phosphatase PAP2 family protein n=1 Tax=Cellulomonas sp. ICMP 17802 TaxID=3239199 RepID=UPI00351B5846